MRLPKPLYSRNLAVFVIFFVLLQLSTSSSAAMAAEVGPGESLPRLLADLDAYAEKSRRAFGVPGMAMAVVIGDKVVHARGFGSTALQGGRPVDTDTVFQIGSTSKAFTATLVAMMVDKGIMAWDDPVTRHFPGFMMKDPWVTREIMVKDLMAQHTGLAPHAGELQAFFGYSPEAMIASLRHMEPVSSFRSEFAYQNIPFLVAAKLVGTHTGRTYAENLQKHVFGPLGMTNSSVPPSGLAKGDNVTRLHLRQNGRTVMLPRDWAFQDWIVSYAPAGGINSNVNDMAKWLRLNINQGELDGKRLVSAANMEFVHTPVTAVKADIAGGLLAQYCQGWCYERFRGDYTMVWHNGDTAVNHAMIAFMPVKKVGIVILGNLGGVDMPDALARWFFESISGLEPRDYAAQSLKRLLEAEKEAAQLKRPIGAWAPQPLERYEGFYENPVYGKVGILAEGQGLYMTIGPRQTKLWMSPWNRDQFKVHHFLNSDDLMDLACFSMDGQGRVVGFVLEDIRSEGKGYFKKVE